MKTVYVLLIVAVFCFFVPLSLQAEEKIDSDKLKIQSIGTVTKGFPCILKITIKGPGLVPETSLFSNSSVLKVKLISIEDQTEYTISSDNEKGITLSLPDGSHKTDGSLMKINHKFLPEGESQSFLVELWSLWPGFVRNPGITFSDVPPGKYDISVYLPRLGVSSKAVRMNLFPPSETEKQFIEELSQIVPLHFQAHKKGVNWCSLLLNPTKYSISKDKWSKLSENTQKQVAFYKLLHETLTAGPIVPPDQRKKIKETQVPKYLETERQFLFYEVAKDAGEKVDIELSQFIKKHPDLEWRYKKIQSNEGSFFWDQKQKAKYRKDKEMNVNDKDDKSKKDN